MTWRWAFVTLAACGSGANHPSTDIQYLTLSAAELDLAGPLGVTTTASLTATNDNAVPTFASVMLDDFVPPEFALAGTDCPDVLDPGASCTVSIAFTPDFLGRGADDTGVEIGASFATLSGTGEVALAITPTAQDFGTIYLDVNSAPFAFTLTNPTAVVQHPTAKLTGAAQYQFAIVASTCADIPPMGSCSVSVELDGGFDGAMIATLDVDGADAALTGTVSTVASPQLYTEPSLTDFGDVGIYASPIVSDIEIVNGTHMDLAQLDVAISGLGHAAFPVLSNSCTSPIADGASCYVEIRTNVTGLGMATATMTVLTPGIPVLHLPLSANFVDDGPRIAIAPTGVVTFMPDQMISFTITNPSSSMRFIDAVTVPAPYQISNDNCPDNELPIDSSGSCGFTLQYVSSAGGDAHQVLTVTWNEGQQDTIMLAPAN